MKKRLRHSSKIKKTTLFRPENGVMLHKLQVSTEATYSITRPTESKKIIVILKNHLTNIGLHVKHCTITDATACVGGDTLQFSRLFKHVNSVEMNPEHYAMLLNNINVYNRTNITTYCADYLKVLAKLTQDVVFIDPPWGGPRYKDKTNIRLQLSNTPIEDVVFKLLRLHVSLIVLKVPTNFNVPHFVYHMNKKKENRIRSFHSYHLNKMNIIVIATKYSPAFTRKQLQ